MNILSPQAVRNQPVKEAGRLIRFEDGDDTIFILTNELPDGRVIANCDEAPGICGFGFSILDAIADLFGKMPRAASEREERDQQTYTRDHERDYRKHSTTAE